MKRQLYGLTTLLLILLCGRGTPQTRPLSRDIEPNSGTLSWNDSRKALTYTNDYFAFSYDFPAGWGLFPPDALRRIDKEKQEEAERQYRAQNKLPPDAMVRVLGNYTLAISEKYGGEQVPAGEFNSEIDIWAEEVNPEVSTSDPATVANFFRSLNSQGKPLRGPSNETISGRNFVRVDFLVPEKGRGVYQSRAVAFEGDYVVGIDVKAGSKEEMDKLLLSVGDALVFRNRPESGVVTGNAYRNYFFGFTYTFPNGWATNSRWWLNAISQQRYEQVKSQLFGDRPIPPSVRIEQTPIYELLLATRTPIGKEGKGYNSRVEIWAEQDPLVSTGEQYFRNRTFLIDPLAEVTRAPTKFTYGEREFLRADRHVKVEKGWFESRIVRVEQGYVLVMEIHAGTKEEVDQIARTAESIAFEGRVKQ